MNKFRTHNCEELSEKDLDKKVIISGWLLIHRPLKMLSADPIRWKAGHRNLFSNKNNLQNSNAEVNIHHIEKNVNI